MTDEAAAGAAGAGGKPGVHFLPGTNFRVREEWRRSARPLHRAARVRSPGRLHFQVFDFSTMQPMIPGGGGIGISTTTAITELEVAHGGPGGGAPFPTARHLLKLFLHLVGYQGDDVHVSVPTRVAHVHSGYGSNVTFNTALVAGLNALFGTPFSAAEMWDILTQNFVENADDTHVYWGLETGVGESCVLYGGLVWVDQWARYVGSATAHLWVVTATGDVKKLAAPRLAALGQLAEKGVGDVDEQDVLYRECLEMQAEHGEELLRFLEYRMKPRLLADDARGMLALGWEMNEKGNHRILERMWNLQVLQEIAETTREAGALYAAISSAGPSLGALCESEESAMRVRAALEARLGDRYSSFAIGRAGEKLRVEVVDWAVPCPPSPSTTDGYRVSR